MRSAKRTASGGLPPVVLASAEVLDAFYRDLFLPLVWRATWRHGLSKEDARDVVQEAFLLAMAKMSGEGNPRGWLFQVVDNLCANHQRKTFRRARLAASGVSKDWPGQTQKRRPAISEHDEHLASLIPAWIEATQEVEIPTGLDVDEVLRRALELLVRLRGTPSPASFPVGAESVETFHALCTLLDQPGSDPKVLLADASAAFEFISALDWPKSEFGGREDLLAHLTFLCWRYARRAESPAAESKWRKTHSAIDNANTRSNAELVLATPIGQRAERAREYRLEDPELLLGVCEVLSSRVEVSPATVRDGAEFFYEFLAAPRLKISLFEEREYFLGEFALIAGGASRVLFRKVEARRWFAVAEANFVRAPDSSANLARLAYQRLALALEERRFDEVLKQAPLWSAKFERMGLPEDALKCGFLEAGALRETGKVREAIALFRDICAKAEELRIPRLAAMATSNLAQDYRVIGDLKEALAYARKALPLLEQLNNQVSIAKLRWCVGDILREDGKLSEAIVAYREALELARALGTRADVSAIHLVLADVLLDAGQERQAEWEIRAALPIIEEEQMVPEGMAALSLLQESLRRRQINRQALRELPGYCRDPKA